jgi:hypothetical protein
MSETKFTPGPWEKKFNYLRVQAVAEPKVAICYTDTFGTGRRQRQPHSRRTRDV